MSKPRIGFARNIFVRSTFCIVSKEKKTNRSRFFLPFVRSDKVFSSARFLIFPNISNKHIVFLLKSRWRETYSQDSITGVKSSRRGGSCIARTIRNRVVHLLYIPFSIYLSEKIPSSYSIFRNNDSAPRTLLFHPLSIPTSVSIFILVKKKIPRLFIVPSNLFPWNSSRVNNFHLFIFFQNWNFSSRSKKYRYSLPTVD